ncbi:30S ribosomal protein S8 [Candidatus Dojkabacteria bacterium]|uniref:Small ribosomal subunit protein uS8 n=1 Tax=Candidatus Dojkabacteria bacterium TaxID=2099670 RepID=A0A3M0Z1W7_9BACT|nr:MAG: 30S ribosomal protein S8 [Candidatus Dojkabacteria bacterium]
MVSDLISDSLTRIRNAILVNHKTVELVNSKMIRSILDIMKDKGFIDSYEVQGNFLLVNLRYDKKGPKIKGLERVSKPGVRKYLGYRDIKPVYNGLGVSIFSTPKGVMTGEDAVRLKVGGEYLCFIY